MTEDARMCRMTSGRVFVVAWMFLAAVAVNAGGQEITVPEGWIELPADGATTASVFVVVKNPTMYDVYLVSAVSEVAEKVELRQTVEGTAKNLREITVPAYGSLKMKAGGVHLQLVGLERPLKEGETIRLTLTTDGAVKLRVQASVRVDGK